MSSFQKLTTNINDKQALIEALKSKGYKPEVSDTKQNVRGHYADASRKAEIVLKKEDLSDGGDIGFSKQADGNYEVVADTYVLRKIKLPEFVKDLTNVYAEKKVMAQARKAGLILQTRKVLSNGSISITFNGR